MDGPPTATEFLELNPGSPFYLSRKVCGATAKPPKSAVTFLGPSLPQSKSGIARFLGNPARPQGLKTLLSGFRLVAKLMCRFRVVESAIVPFNGNTFRSYSFLSSWFVQWEGRGRGPLYPPPKADSGAASQKCTETRSGPAQNWEIRRGGREVQMNDSVVAPNL